MLPKYNFHKILFSTIAIIIYLIFYYLVLLFLFNRDSYVYVNSITKNTLYARFMMDVIITVPFIASFLIVENVTQSHIYTLEHSFLTLVLFCIYISIFLIKKEYTIQSYYLLVFYLFFIAFSEEFIFRGVLYLSWCSKFSWQISACISGIFWCIPHLFIPILEKGNCYDWKEWIITFSSEIGGFIFVSFILCWILKRSNNNIFIITLLHAILDCLKS